MELECVESLGPDTLLPHASSPHDSRSRPTSLPPAPPSDSRPAPRPHSQSLNSPDLINCSHNFLPSLNRTYASSPLTRSPSPSPKRRRIAYNPTCPSFRQEAPPLPPTLHPLARLCHRDIRYVVRTPNHLANTSVTPTMREEVVGWCGDMVADLDLPEGIVAIATNIFDRFIAQQRSCSKSILYALTASCLLLACKLILDDDVPQEEISSRAGVRLDDIHLMEGVILNVLRWDVNVVTPHEVIHELDAHLAAGTSTDRQRALQDSLMLNSLLDYALAGMRATSVGVACYILSDFVTMRNSESDHKAHNLYDLAFLCGVNLAEVDYCVARLRAGIDMPLEEFEDVDSDEEED